MNIALVGNQNSGKTTLFNQLTGANQRVGNFPGVTIQAKKGVLLKDKDINIIDLPGVYSLSYYSKEELITRDFLLNERPDAIINIVDATNIQRNLYLTLQLIELPIPLILALNMMDEVQANHTSIDIPQLKEVLKIPIIPISASKNQGLDELITMVKESAKNHNIPKFVDYCSGAVHRAIHSIGHLIEDHALNTNLPRRFVAIRLIEGDEALRENLKLSLNEIDMIDHSIKEMESEVKMDSEAALADMRYQFIEKLCKETITKVEESKEFLFSVKLDNILTNRILAFPIFIIIMLLVFWLSFSLIGNNISDFISRFFTLLTSSLTLKMNNYGLNPIVVSLLANGLFGSLLSVLEFLPIILTLFLLLSFLEDCGYLARIAYIMDQPLRKLGLSGRSIVPLLLGFTCTVPAIMATRTLAGEKDRRLTIFLIPFMSCGAKLPIYAFFTAAFFPKHQPLIMISLYLFGILSAVIISSFLKKIFFKGNALPFVMELPNYRFPSFKSIVLLAWDKTKDFIQRAFSVILLASIIVWFLQSFDTQLNIVSDNSLSLLALVAKLLKPVFSPLGLGDWRIITALISGFSAKECIVSTLVILTNDNLTTLSSLFDTLTSLSFLVFTLLYSPCVAALKIARTEYGKIKGGFYVFIVSTGFAWIISFIVYNLGKLFL